MCLACMLVYVLCVCLLPKEVRQGHSLLAQLGCLLLWQSTKRKQLEQGSVCLTYMLSRSQSISMKKVYVGTPGRNLEAMKKLCFLVHFSKLPLPVFLAPRNTNPGVVPTTNQEMPHGLAHKPIQWGYFLNRCPHFPNDSSLCQVDIKTIQHRFFGHDTASAFFMNTVWKVCPLLVET